MANTLKISVENEDVLTHSVANGVDITNRLASVSGVYSYTFLHDGYFTALVWIGNQTVQYNIDSVAVFTASFSGSTCSTFTFYAKKGQVLTLYDVGNHNNMQLNGTLYGIKR